MRKLDDVDWEKNINKALPDKTRLAPPFELMYMHTQRAFDQLGGALIPLGSDTTRMMVTPHA